MIIDLLVNIVGWAGMVLLLLAYFLVSSKKLSGTSKSYQLLNLLGAIGILVNSYYFRALPSVGLNIVWALIALKTLILTKKEISNQ